MRRLVIGLIVLALVWSGWWELGAFAIERGVATWAETRRHEGWQAEVAQTRVAGYPTALNATTEGITLTVPSGAMTLRAGRVDLRTQAYWPLNAEILLPQAPITFETPQDTYALSLSDAVADLSLRPGLPLLLDELRLTSPQWSLVAEAGSLLTAQNLFLVATQEPATAPAFRTRLTTDTLAPGAELRNLFGLPSDWAIAFETFLIDITLDAQTFSRPERPDVQLTHLRTLALNAVDLHWDSFHLTASGTVTSDASGTPSGQLTFLIKNWREVFEIISQKDPIKAHIPPQADLVLNGLANIGGDPETLDLTISFRDGAMLLGPIPLGPAPRFIFEAQRQ